MVTVDWSHVQLIWPPLNPTSSRYTLPHTRKNNGPGPTISSRDQPASLHKKADEILGRDKQPKSTVALAQHQGRDSAFQQESEVVGAQGCHNDPVNGDAEADDDFPLIDELLAFSSKGISTVYQNSEDTPQHLKGPALNTSGSCLDPNPGLDNGVGNCQGTRDRPLILEDDDSDTPELAPEAIAVSVDAGAGPASELSKGPCWDVEDECYVDDDFRPIPPLEQEGLASTPALAQPHPHHDPPGSSQNQISQHEEGGMGGALDEPAPHALPQPLSESGGGGSDESASELERDMQLVFEEQEKSSPAPAPNSLRPRRPSAEPPHPHTEQEHDRGGTSCGRSEELGRGPPGRSQDRGEEAQEQQQRQEVAVELMREDHGVDGEEPEERGPADPALGGKPATLKRGHQDMHTEISSDPHHSVNNDDNHSACDTSDEGPRPAKRRKPARAVTPPLHLRRSPPPPSTTRAEIDEAQSQDDDGCSSTFVKEQHCTSQTSRSPSAAAEAVPAAEYQEWAFQGFLKRIRIGDGVTYHLEFKLPSISEHLRLPIDPKALDTCSSKEAPAKVPTHHNAAAHSKIHQAPLQPKKKRKYVKWTVEEDATVLKMRDEDGCSWEEIHHVLPHRPLQKIRAHYYAIRAGVGEADISRGQQQKRRRGRPRKQT